jgi:hypothetical protein
VSIAFTHCTAQWSYSGFNAARTRLAAQIGIVLDDMVGFGSFSSRSTRGQTPWPHPSTNPLIYLLNHSDCDGNLSPAECRLVTPALRAAVKYWPDADYDKRCFLELALGMERAAALNEPLEFH